MITTGHPWPCACERFRELLKYTDLNSEYSEEYYEEDYDDMIEYAPIIEQEDIFKNSHDDDAHINTIKLLTDVSSIPRCILDSGANATSSMTNRGLLTPIHVISGSISATIQCIIENQAFICPSANSQPWSLHSLASTIHLVFHLGIPHLRSPWPLIPCIIYLNQ